MMEDKRKPGRPKGTFKKRLNLAETEQFVFNSMKMVLNKHMSHKEYMLYCRQQGLAYNQANVYWNRIWSLIKERFQQDKDKLVDKHLSHYWTLYDNSITNNEYNTARQILNDIAKLQGLNEPDKVEITGSVITFKFGEDGSSGVQSDEETT